MSNFTDLTSEQIRTATKEQIVANINSTLARMSKRDLVVLLLETETVSDTPVCTYGKDGQIAKQVEVERDVATGEKVSGRVIEWTYYKTGEVDKIIVSQRSAADKEIGRKVIQHYLDGKRPTVEETINLDVSGVEVKR